MTTPERVWFVTGAGRGLGLAVARAALEAGHKVVAAARRPEVAEEALGDLPGAAENLLAERLDVTRSEDAVVAVNAALNRFGRIDVLVNAAGYGQIGAFEANAPEDVARQFDVNVFGLMHVTRAVLPSMRARRSGRIYNVSSIAGVRGRPGGSLYAASKFAVSGFSEGLAAELKPLGIFVTVLEPGYFRTDFLDPSSMRFGTEEIADYAEVTAAIRDGYARRNHRQPGDPAKLAQTLLSLADEPAPPVHFAVGSDAVEIVRAKLAAWGEELEAWRTLSAAADGDFADAV
ncbi:NAD dependent epimerase/dehydratase family [uncultured Alphaproteobacteria bacterium]|uniref:NAD dependent epimerase/dehydratase family n=1 Tax=uncultured Alphaproteobacteria bacterium TaxID=91750 RepID=A0A212JG73_9PROT|nr:NAD dependent epimerase/dehydratase family [uncultured Alphaproteobacteria bacterium]